MEKFTRRSFLATTGLSVSFLVGCSVIPAIPKRPQPNTEAALGWISLTPDGQWLLYTPRMEMGQNILSSLREVAAIELRVRAEQIKVMLPSTRSIPLVKATVGSDSLRELCLPLAQACFALRSEIIRRASLRSPYLAQENISFLGSAVIDIAGKSIALRDLAQPVISLEARDIPIEQLQFFRTPASRAAEPKPHAQAEDIARGKPLYAGDIRLEGMLYAVVLRSPWADRALAPSRLMQWDEAAVRSVPGFHSVLQHPLLAGPAFVATRMSSLQTMRVIAEPKWSEPESREMDPMAIIDVDKALASGSFTKSSGSVQEGKWPVDMRIDIPMASHASIEPRCAVAQPQTDGGMKLWCGSQDVFYIRDVLSRDLDFSPEEVEVQAMRIGGGFGGKTIATVEREAGIIAKMLGKPVKVQWSREDELQGAFHRQPASQRIRARLDSSGMISDWQHSLSTSHVLFTNAIVPPWMQRFTNLIGDDGAARGQMPIYGFSRKQLSMQLTRLPTMTGPWRGLGAGPNVLAIEMAMDAAAHATGADPVQFRLAHLKASKSDNPAGDPQRLVHCLESVIRLAKSRPLNIKQSESAFFEPKNGNKVITATGTGCGPYKGMSYAAAIAQIDLILDIDKRIQSIQVKKLWCTHDCGRIVDAQGVLAQVQGNLVWTVGMVLMEHLDAPRGTPLASNFSEYNIPRITDVPPMEIELIDSTMAPSGAGETAMVAGVGAITNAVVRAIREAGLSVPNVIPILATA